MAMGSVTTVIANDMCRQPSFYPQAPRWFTRCWILTRHGTYVMAFTATPACAGPARTPVLSGPRCDVRITTIACATSIIRHP